MVIKISAWRHKFPTKALAMSHYTPDMFVKSQWQRCSGVSLYYLGYRWFMACVFLSIMLASLMEVGRPGGDIAHYAKWTIYLTHWGLTICTLQALLAAYVVTRTRRLPDQETEAMKMDHMLRIYWALHNCATVGAFAITFIYWFLLFDPDKNKVDAVNLLVHVGNSVLMMTDLIVISHPTRLIDIYWPLLFALSYVSFNYIYFVAGGTDRKGRVYIYKILNWERPWHTLVVVQFCVLFVLVLHVFVCVFSFLRCKLAQHCRNRQAEIAEARSQHLQGATNEIPINDLV